MKHQKAIFVLLCALYWLAYPWAQSTFFRALFDNDAFPSDGDTYFIGIGMTFISWGALTPIFVLCIWLAIRRYPGRIGLFSWNHRRAIWSSVWTVLATPCSILFILFAIDSIREGQWLLAVFDILALPLIEWWRSAMVMCESKEEYSLAESSR